MTTIEKMCKGIALDTMIEECLNTPERIARAKAKAERIKSEASKAEAKKRNAKAKHHINMKATIIISFLVGSLWGYVCHALMF